VKHARRLAELDAALDQALDLCRRSAAGARRGTRLAQLTAAALAAVAGGCSCIVHEESVFEAACRDRGGEVHTLDADRQICVPSLAFGGVGGADDGGEP
jgi:hypothetical protein